MDARSEEIGRLLREQEQAIIAERAQAVRMAGAAQQAAITGQVVSTPGEVLLCEQRFCEVPGGTGPALATAGLARADGTGAWLTCDACAARMLGDALYPVVVVSLDQWQQLRQRREQEIAGQIAAGKAGRAAAVTAGRPGSLAGPAPATAPRDGSQWLARARPWLIGAAVSVGFGLIFVIAGAEENSQGYLNAGGNQTPGAPELWIGGILIVVPILAIAISILVSVARFSAGQARRYRAWKKTLTPEQLAVVRMAEAAATFAALEGAHLYLKHSNERARTRHAAANARHEYIKHYTQSLINHEPFNEPPPPGMSGAWGR